MHRLLCALLCGAAIAAAQIPAPLSLADAVREARTRRPDIQAAEARVRAAEGQRVQAALRPNPQITLQNENSRFWGRPGYSLANDSEDFAFLTHTFEAAGKRASRIDAAEAGIRSAEAERDLLERQIAASVSRAYWTAAATQGFSELLVQSLDNFEQIVDYHRTRVSEGAMAEVDLMRVLLERDRVTVSARSAVADASQAMIALLREIGRTEFAPVRLVDGLAADAVVPKPDITAVLALRPEMSALRRSVQLAQARVRLQENAWKPDYQPFFGYKRATGFNTLMGGLQVELPFGNRNQGEIATAIAQVREAESELRFSEVTVRAEVEAAWQNYLARRAMLTETLAAMRQRAEDIANIAMAAYREGAVDLLRLLDAQRVRLEAMNTWYQALADFQMSVTTLRIVTGDPL